MRHTENIQEIRIGKKVFFQTWLPDNKMSAMILLIHGLGEHSGRYGTHFSDYYIGKNIGISTFDLPGHGKSYGKKGHIDDPVFLLEMIDNELTKIKGQFPGVPIFLYGHSFGGEIALWYILAKNPQIEGIILTAPLIGPKDPVPPMKMLLAKTMEKLMPSFSLKNGLRPEDLSRNDQIVNNYISDPFVHPVVSAKTGMLIINRGYWILENAIYNTSKILLMVGEKENIVNPQAIYQFQMTAPKVTYKVWPGAFHELHNEPEKNEIYDFTFEWIRNHLQN